MQPARAVGATILVAAMVCLPAAASARTARAIVDAVVEANQVWQKVNLRLRGHGVLHFQARGQWVFNPAQPPVGGDGAQNLPTADRTSYTFSGPQGREGQLIGKIGRQMPFVAGARGVHKVRRREIGQLYLMINDDYKGSVGAGLADNSGHLTVTVEFEWPRLTWHRSPCVFAIFGCPPNP
jgi:hypothetical protein